MRFSYLFAAITAAVFGVLTFTLCKFKKLNKKKSLYFALLAAYVACTAAVTILCKYRGERAYSCIPFSAYAVNFEMGNTWFFVQEAMNILLFIPFGVILGIKKKTRLTVLFGLCFSLTLELMQFVTGRGSFDVNDLIWNTLGTFLGAVLIKALRKRFTIR